MSFHLSSKKEDFLSKSPKEIFDYLIGDWSLNRSITFEPLVFLNNGRYHNVMATGSVSINLKDVEEKALGKALIYKESAEMIPKLDENVYDEKKKAKNEVSKTRKKEYKFVLDSFDRQLVQFDRIPTGDNDAYIESEMFILHFFPQPVEKCIVAAGTYKKGSHFYDAFYTFIDENHFKVVFKCSGPQKNYLKMYEPDADFAVKTGAAFLANNFSVFKHEARSVTYAAFVGKNVVKSQNVLNIIQLLSWNDKMEQSSCELLSPNELVSGSEATAVEGIDSLTKESPSSLMQSTDLENQVTGKFGMKPCTFTRGIGCVDNIIIAGSNSGEITLITCSGESNFQQQKKLLKEHNAPVTDIATCSFDMVTVTGDVAGNVVVWSKNMKSTIKKISTNQQLSVINILRKQVLCGTYFGQILIFSVSTGALMAEVNAHSRQITSLAVAVESAYILSASEDSYVRIWKLHSRKPEAYKVEFRFAQKFENMSIMGAEFSGARGSGFLVTHYENSKIFSFHINRKSAGGPAALKDGGSLSAAGSANASPSLNDHRSKT